jgi:hypothetical protein
MRNLRQAPIWPVDTSHGHSRNWRLLHVRQKHDYSFQRRNSQMSEEGELRVALRRARQQIETAQSTVIKALQWICPHDNSIGVVTTQDRCPSCGKLKPSLAQASGEATK